ncbi:hypothetical protein P5673_020475 [Acropora cervicornis]|uniref:Uncharacterized protein n=1 Tax=Acropora cervicornis TaxID=6130 RepID=A0AAD9Q9W3_ACRCE|nr:hypothetical protein P5673_020475 [Acropora cervicornis]
MIETTIATRCLRSTIRRHSFVLSPQSICPRQPPCVPRTERFSWSRGPHSISDLWRRLAVGERSPSCHSNLVT